LAQTPIKPLTRILWGLERFVAAVVFAIHTISTTSVTSTVFATFAAFTVAVTEKRCYSLVSDFGMHYLI